MCRNPIEDEQYRKVRSSPPGGAAAARRLCHCIITQSEVMRWG